jgi:hypothetical protein
MLLPCTSGRSNCVAKANQDKELLKIGEIR